MALDPRLLEILACPEDKGPLYYFEADQVLYNPRLNRTYEVRDDIPIMLIEEATTLKAGAAADMDSRIEAEGLAPTFSD